MFHPIACRTITAPTEDDEFLRRLLALNLERAGAEPGGKRGKNALNSIASTARI